MTAAGTKQMSPALNWCFTLNNYTEEEEKAITTLVGKDVRFLVIGHEVGEKGTPHLQGYMQMLKKVRLTGMQKINGRAHWEVSKGTPQQNIKYCTKTDKDYVMLGEVKETAQAAKKTNMYEAIVSCSTWNEVLKVPGVAHCMSYAREVWNNRPIEPMEDFEPRPWQAHLLEMLEKPAKGHELIFVYDEKGCAGKTYLCKYLVSNYDAFYCSPSKSSDIFCAYANQNIILYDIPKSIDEQYVNWGAIEKLKDGILFSGKYNSTTKFRTEEAHVIIFSNNLIPDGTFSENRKITKIDIAEFKTLSTPGVHTPKVVKPSFISPRSTPGRRETLKPGRAQEPGEKKEGVPEAPKVEPIIHF